MYLDKAVLWKKGAAFLFPFQNMMKAEQKVLKRFKKGCVDYHLLQDGDRILIALSGGKDSLELVRLLAQRARIYKPHIEVEAAHIIMDNIPYETDRSYVQRMASSSISFIVRSMNPPIPERPVASSVPGTDVRRSSSLR